MCGGTENNEKKIGQVDRNMSHCCRMPRNNAKMQKKAIHLKDKRVTLQLIFVQIIFF